MTRGTNFRVNPSAQALLDTLRFDDFKRAFGDCFVRGLQTGGEFYCVIRITSVSSTAQNELSVELQAEFNGLVASGGFQGKFTRANASASTRSKYTVTMYQKAGTGQEISPTVEISEAINRFKTFPEIARTSAVAYETEIATYDTLPLPIPTPEEQEDFIFALRDAREKKLRYIQTRNDLEFAVRNPMFFETLPSNDILSSAINVYTRLINAVMDHGTRLARGQIRPPQVFDSSKVSPPIIEPASIPLMRVQVSILVTIPNWIGIFSAVLVTGLTTEDGEVFPSATELGLNVITTRIPNDRNHEEETIASINPPPGSVVPRGTTVTVTLWDPW